MQLDTWKELGLTLSILLITSCTLQNAYAQLSTDKTSYYPGDTVSVTGTLDPSENVTLLVLNPDEEDYLQKEIKTGIDGKFSFQFNLGKDANLGEWLVEVLTGADILEVKFKVEAPPPNKPPVAVINAPGPYRVNEPIKFSGNESSAEHGKIVTYQWDFGDGISAAGPETTHSYEKDGKYIVKLNVTDNLGGIGTKEMTIDVIANKPPVAVISAAGPYTEGKAIKFSGNESSAEHGKIVTYQWDFGDGSSAEGPETTHSYQKDGKYIVKLKVTDNLGGIGTKEMEIDVKPVSFLAPPFDRPEVQAILIIIVAIIGLILYLWLRPKPKKEIVTTVAVTTDRSLYNLGERVTAKISVSPVKSDNPIKISIYDPQKIHKSDSVIPLKDGKASYVFTLSDSDLTGKWNITASYDGKEGEEIFTVEAPPPPAPPPPSKNKFCIECGKSISFDAKECPECYLLQASGGPDAKPCRNCDTLLPPTAKFCWYCGNKQPEQPAQPAV